MQHSLLLFLPQLKSEDSITCIRRLALTLPLRQMLAAYIVSSMSCVLLWQPIVLNILEILFAI